MASRPGERVVVDGQYKLQPNSRVKIGGAPAHSGEANPGGHAGPKRPGPSRRPGWSALPKISEVSRAVNISEPFIRRPIATSLLMAGVVMMGMLGYFLLPDLGAAARSIFPTIQVAAQYPGASPDVMASSVTTPLERQFGQISGLQQHDFGQLVREQRDHAAIQCSTATSTPRRRMCRRRSMPPAACCRRTCRIRRPTARSIRRTRRSSRSRSPRTSLPLEKVNDLADTVLAQKLSEVTGVGLVTIEGNQKPAVRVQINPAAIAVARHWAWRTCAPR